MKDFVKWLGVNEKIAKVGVWLLIIMVMLILTNTLFESIGIPHYAITYENITKINPTKAIRLTFECIVCILNFYAIVLLIFRTKEIKPIFKYTVIYAILNFIIYKMFGYIASQVLVIVYILLFCYLYSNKNKKYIIYGILAMIFNILTQGIWYSIKANLIDYTNIDGVTKAVLSIDYFIIMAVIILVKEIYLKKRRDTNA